jgi:hypothetical protein
MAEIRKMKQGDGGRRHAAMEVIRHHFGFVLRGHNFLLVEKRSASDGRTRALDRRRGIYPVQSNTSLE